MTEGQENSLDFFIWIVCPGDLQKGYQRAASALDCLLREKSNCSSLFSHLYQSTEVGVSWAHWFLYQYDDAVQTNGRETVHLLSVLSDGQARCSMKSFTKETSAMRLHSIPKHRSSVEAVCTAAIFRCQDKVVNIYATLCACLINKPGWNYLPL